MLKKIILLTIVLAAVLALFSGCLYIYLLDEMIGGDDDERDKMKDYVTARGEIYDYEQSEGRYCEFELNEEYVQNDVKITVYGAWFYEDIKLDDGEIKSFIDFYVGIENMSDDDMAFVYMDNSDVRLNTGETATFSYKYSDYFETAYEPGQYVEGLLSFEVHHTKLSDFSGVHLWIVPLCDEEDSLINPNDPYVFEYNMSLVHDEFEFIDEIEFRSNVIKDLKLDLTDFGILYKTNYLHATDISGPVTVTVPAVAVYKQHELDFGQTYDIVAIPVLYEYDSDIKVYFDPRFSYIICDGSQRIDCEWELSRFGCVNFMEGSGMASYILYFPIDGKADVDFQNLHFVISATIDLDTFEDVGDPISMDFVFH